ncbi:MAG: universal stress protein [Myxococcales bacterium]|nr:universal stress protein [Myxococcales bacterium]
MNSKQKHTMPYAVVVGVDYSELGDLALERACELAMGHDRAHMHVVHVETATVASSYGLGPSRRGGGH